MICFFGLWIGATQSGLNAAWGSCLAVATGQGEIEHGDSGDVALRPPSFITVTALLEASHSAQTATATPTTSGRST